MRPALSLHCSFTVPLRADKTCTHTHTHLHTPTHTHKDTNKHRAYTHMYTLTHEQWDRQTDEHTWTQRDTHATCSNNCDRSRCVCVCLCVTRWMYTGLRLEMSTDDAVDLSLIADRWCWTLMSYGMEMECVFAAGCRSSRCGRTHSVVTQSIDWIQ